MNPDGRFELGSRHALVITVRNHELQINCFDERGARVESFTHLVAGLTHLERTAFRAGCSFFLEPGAPAAFQLNLTPNAREASYWQLSKAKSKSDELKLVLGMAMWRLGVNGVSAIQPNPSTGVIFDDFWYQVKLGDFNVAMGFAKTETVGPETPYPLAGNYLCLEIVNPRAEPALRGARLAAHSRPIKEAVASIKQLHDPFPRLCMQFKFSDVPRLHSFLAELRKAS
jgi:hypothetical protein